MKKDCFIKGTEPASTVRLNELHQKARITYPADGTLIALDLEIPEDLQRIPFQFKPALQRYEWVLNDKRTGSSDPLFLRKPEKGCFRLSIVDKEARVIDSVVFTVK
jgi:penicillin-binding protein 1C